MVALRNHDTELRELQNEGMISAHWSFIRDTVVPKPGAGEVVMTKAWVERGLSLPCSEFFLSILNTYGLQPHNICPNSYLLLSNFATREGHLGIRPDVKLWQFFFRVKKETKDKAMLNCGHDIHAPTWSHLATLAEENLRTILRVPAATRRRRFRKTKRRKRSKHSGGSSTYEASPRQSFRLKPEPGEASTKKPKIVKPLR
ncbi:hypothetical protein QYE76_041507 [Lolium multiflorum]|uniref:Transposase (putative) gypsy type domain-containing protein n=1 Tax=Lolium multiflorum TaxID=4521 RepID=A0AAD8WU81_LOLMU|nr:hypothetical protein QYE76_041507 [Lolium multiflorum]